MTLAPSRPLRFGPDGRFTLQPLERRLLVDGEPAPIGARAFDLLLELAAHPGALRTKNELIEAVWPGVVVEEGNLATQVSMLRKVLGGDAISTIPGRGYRFTSRLHDAGAGPPPATPSAAAPEKLRTNLSAQLPPLIGRAADLAALGELVGPHRLVSIVGAGGMGKTVLAQAFLHARRGAHTHGVCWVDLAPVSDPAAVPATVIAALGLNAGGGDPLTTLCALCMPLQMLVALDNAEHLLDATARVAQAMVEAAPQVCLLVTSQAPLKVAAERVYRLHALEVPAGPLPAEAARAFGAVALFEARAMQADLRWRLTDDKVPVVIDLCRQLDGLPLAIELAAARAPMLGVRQLAASMGDRLRLLTRGANRMAPARQQTLRATLAWSHGFLDDRERTVFRRLAVFAGSGSLTTIQQVVADPDGALDEWAVLDALALLVDRSLVLAIIADDAAEPRYRLLDTPRDYALERLREAGEEELLRQRHLRALASLCEAAWHRAFSGEVRWQTWHRTFASDADNAVEAMAHAIERGDRVAALRIGVTRLWSTTVTLPASQRIALAEQCLAQVDESVPPALRVRAWLQASIPLGVVRPRQAQEAMRQATELVKASAALRDDRFLHYRVLCRVIELAGRGAAGDIDLQAVIAEARALEDPRWPPQRRLWRIQAECVVALAGSSEAVRLGREMLALDLAAGGSGFGPRVNLIDFELAAGDARAAARTGESLVAELQGGRHEKLLAAARLNLVAACLSLDELPRARTLAQDGWAAGRLFGMQPYWGDCLALLAAMDGRPRAAALLAGYADAAYAARDEDREPNEAAAHERACAHARAALGEAGFERLHDEGRRLADDEVHAIAFAAADAG